MYSLKKAVPAVAGDITLIDPLINRDINQGTKVSLEVQPGYFKVLVKHIPQRPRLYGFIQMMNRGLNLVYLHLNNLLMGVGQCKDLDRDTDLFQSKDLVQYKGL